tara:strand:+ start:410 stop:655 length:246 start_codon:yes stop_codon:yes gene_type:complete
MKIINNFGTRRGYNETHVAFIIRAKYRRKGGAFIDVFVEATLDSGGVRSISLREDGTNEALSVQHLEEEHKLYELILNQTL